MLNREHPDASSPSGPSGSSGADKAGRLNLLLSDSTWRDQSAVRLLPQVLDPLGVSSFEVHSGEEAEEVIRSYPIHIAVVDMTIPLTRTSEPSEEGGCRLLQLLRRLDQPPPTIVVRPRQTRRESARTLSDALREGAFAVLDRPISLETMLETLRRILRRYYANVWPG